MKTGSHKLLSAGVLLLGLLSITPLFAHHILGRPSYSLNEDSNTPPSMQAELQAGNYDVLYMAYPAFPKVNERGRINIHASSISTGKTYTGEMTFKVKRDTWFSSKTEMLGTQKIDDGVFRQGFSFNKKGDYTILAEFSDGGHVHIMNFPLRVGTPAIIGPAGYVVLMVMVSLLIATFAGRKRLQRARIKRHHSGNNPSGMTNNTARM